MMNKPEFVLIELGDVLQADGDALVPLLSRRDQFHHIHHQRAHLVKFQIDYQDAPHLWHGHLWHENHATDVRYCHFSGHLWHAHL